MPRHKRQILRKILLCLLMLPAMQVLSVPDAAAAGTIYYVDNLTASDSTGTCSDTNAGTSPATPWCDFTNFSDRTMQPGDYILLRRGDTWHSTQPNNPANMLVLSGSGTSTAWITVDAYGPSADPRPIITLDYNRTAVRWASIWLTNGSFWQFGDLELSGGRGGIVGWYDNSQANQGFTVVNVDIHNISGAEESSYAFCGSGGSSTGPDPNDIAVPAAIEIGGWKQICASYIPPKMQDVSIASVSGTHNQHTVYLADIADGVISGVIANQDDGQPISGGADPDPCFASLYLDYATNITVADSVIYRGAACPAPNGTSGVFLGNDTNINMVNNAVVLTPNVNSNDEAGVDYEVADDHVNLLDNGFADNYGPAVEVHSMYGTNPSENNTNNQLEGNTFLDDGLPPSQTPSGTGAIWMYDDNVIPTGQIDDNLFAEPAGPTSTSNNGTFNGYTFDDNRILDASSAEGASVFNSAVDYSGVAQPAAGWQYEEYGSSGWTPLPEASGGNWADPQTGAAIDEFTQTPASCGACETARAWTAPTGGVIDVRSRAVLPQNYLPGACAVGPSGSQIRITLTHSGTTTTLWPASNWSAVNVEANPATGDAANLDYVPVAAGDVLRFESQLTGNAACSQISWDPSLAYSSGRPISWEFNCPETSSQPGPCQPWGTSSPYSLSEGWSVDQSKSPYSTVTVSGGALHLTTPANFAGGVLDSPQGLSFSGTADPYVHVSITNPTSTDQYGALAWVATTGAGAFTQQQTTIFVLQPGLNVGDIVPPWGGQTIYQLMLEPITSSEASTFTTDIDYLRISSNP